MDFGLLIVIIVNASLVNNYVLNQFLGVCPFLGVLNQLRSSVGMGLAVTFVMVVSAFVTWPIQIYILDRNGLGFLQIIVFVLVIATLVQFIEIFLRKFVPALYSTMGVFLPLMTTNCAIFGVTLSNMRSNFSYFESILNSLGAGLGFLLAMILLTGIREQIENADPPESFRGLPLTLISATILSLAFTGFGGIIENIFAK